MSDYPEHDKAESVQAESQAIGDFLEWLAAFSPAWRANSMVGSWAGV